MEMGGKLDVLCSYLGLESASKRSNGHDTVLLDSSVNSVHVCINYPGELLGK